MLSLTFLRMQYTDHKPPYRGEPLNIVITAFSDPYILTDEGFLEYSKSVSFLSDVVRPHTGLTISIGRSIGYSEECLGIHRGNKHDADLGDGDEKKVQQLLARQYYFPVMGTCWESFAGAWQVMYLVHPDWNSLPYRWTSLPRLEAKRHSRQQWSVVHRVRPVFSGALPWSGCVMALSQCIERGANCEEAHDRPQRVQHRKRLVRRESNCGQLLKGHVVESRC